MGAIGNVTLQCIDKSTVIMTYQSTSADGKHNWEEYKAGFGSVDTNFWLGNEATSHITTKGKCL